nr:hypothetical protein BaRGS_008511 [Batillaria attramentaria]
MVIVMSPRYLQSDACDFQTKFAHALSPGGCLIIIIIETANWDSSFIIFIIVIIYTIVIITTAVITVIVAIKAGDNSK